MAPLSDMTSVQACETHLSRLFFTPDRVFKLLKPVVLPFVDFSDSDARCAAATKEFERNRAISPDVYLGVTDVVENERVVDRMIVMRRLPAEQELTRLLDQPGLDGLLRQVARRVASMHANTDPLMAADATAASPEAIAKNWSDNFASIEPHIGSIVTAEDFAEVRDLALAYMTGRNDLFIQRIKDGWVRDGHGDLRAEHIYCTDDGPRIIDCVAFDDQLRTSDCLSDVAFLGMDLDRLAGADAAVGFMAAWDEFTNEHHPSSLAHFYVAYRAHVRCKIACLRHGGGDRAAAAEARSYHDLALRHLRLAKIRLVVVGGGAGTGKSTIAAHVAEHLGATWLRTDEIRKDIAGIGHDCHDFADPGQGMYSDEMTAATYAELIRQTRLLLKAGVSVVVDATWSSAARRELMRDVGLETAAEVTELRTDLPPALAKERIVRRMASIHNPSDATPELVDYIASHFDPWPEAVTIDTRGPIQESLRASLHAFVSQRIATGEDVQERFRVNLSLLRDSVLVSAGLGGRTSSHRATRPAD